MTKRLYLQMAVFGSAVRKVLRGVALRTGAGGTETKAIDKGSGNARCNNVLETMIMNMRLLSPPVTTYNPN